MDFLKKEIKNKTIIINNKKQIITSPLEKNGVIIGSLAGIVQTCPVSFVMQFIFISFIFFGCLALPLSQGRLQPFYNFNF